MKLSFRTKLLLGFVSLLVILGFFTWKLRKVAQESEQDSRWVTHTHEVLQSLEQILSTMVDIETGGRGFVITSNQEFLEPFQSGIERITRLTSSLRMLTADNPLQQRHLDTLEALVKSKKDFSVEVVQTLKTAGSGAAAEKIRQGTGKRSMDRIRSQIEIMKAEENRLLESRREAAAASGTTATFMLNTSLLLLFAFAVFLFFSIRRYPAVLEKSNRDLERQVKKRTESLAILTRLYATLSQINQTIVRTKSRSELFETICKVAVDYGEFRLAWIGLFDPASGEVTPVALSSQGQIQLPFQAINVYQTPFKEGIIGRALSGGTVTYSNDIQADPHMHHWHTSAVQNDFHSTAAVPFQLSDKVAGILNLHAAEVNFFAVKEEQRLLEEMAMDISFALHSMEVEAERKEVEKALRESEARYRNTLDTMLEGCQIVGFDWRYLYLNDAAASQGRRAKGELLGRTMMEMYPGIETTKMFVKARRCMDERIPQLIENEFTFPDGSKGWFDLRIEPAREGIFILSSDITERRQLEERNLRLQRMESVGSLAGGIVHDLNNILAPIMMALGSFRKKLSDPKDQKIVELLETNSKRGADLVKQILTFARGSELKRSHLKPTLVLDEVLKLIKPTFPSNISINLNLQNDLWSISADVTQIHQVFMNLAVNARDAMPQGGTLTFEAENVSIDEHHARMFPEAKPGLYILFKITDTGTGMTPEIMSKIFDPFFTTKEIGKGTGLGLSTVLSIVKGHKGVLDVHSEVGKGTQFRIYLPTIESEKEAQAQREIQEALQGNGELILVVDDDAIVREIATITLEASGYKVITAADGTEALGLYGKHQSDIRLVITDMDMPVMDGATFVRVLRKMSPKVAIVGSSGSSDRSGLKELEASGMNVFLPKPYTSEILLRLVYETLHQK